MDRIGIKNKWLRFYLKLPLYNKTKLEFYEFIIGFGKVFIGLNWAWHTGRGLFIDTQWFFFKWAWYGKYSIADDYNISKSKFQFYRKRILK